MASMRTIRLLLLALVFSLPGCSTLQRGIHLYSADAPRPHSFQYRDGGSSLYYDLSVGKASRPDTLIFFHGGSGCPSWKSVMPGYVSGLTADARVFALNKRFVEDRSLGWFDCGRDFHLANHPDQWVADYSEFIAVQVAAVTPPPRNVVLVGVSEGALQATRIAGLSSAVTHLAIIGEGGYTMRQSLTTLGRRSSVAFRILAHWDQISQDPRSIEKTWYGHPYRWWSDVMDRDPLADFLKLDIPVLVGIGEKDESVPVESARFLEAKFKEAGKHNLVLKVYPGADHRLNADGVSHREEFFAELGRLLRRR